MKQIPNLFTLLNLIFGCLAIVFTLQAGLTLTYDANGSNLVVIPEPIYLASICIAASAVVDFFDGFVARLLKANSEMGKQLDSLADVVSFGVAPSMIIYQFLRLSFAQQADGLDVATFVLFPAFIVAAAAAYRLAKFNISTNQTNGFIGVPSPAAGLTVASFPLIYWYSNTIAINSLLTSIWFWYATIVVISYSMVCHYPMLALKFTSFSFKTFLPFIIIAIVAIIAAIMGGFLCVPITFVAYIIVSQFFSKKTV
jgi:CDP-diacylglycerol---serine O-phosphatidyltransferase